MTYYEELGISPRASEAEVKRSYKRLTLLLHPDQHQDPEIKALADAQMKRLNEIVSMLADPERRRIYDRELLADIQNVRQNIPLSPLIWLRNNRGWIPVSGVFVLFLGAALLIPDFDPARQPAIAQVRTPVTPPKPAVDQAVRLPAGKRSVGTARASEGATGARILRRPAPAAVRSEASFQKPDMEPSRPEPPHPSSFSLSASAMPAPREPVSTAAGPAASKAAPEATPLAGKWVFTPDPMDRQDPKSFPAEYVELTILAADGRLRGSYRSRYKLPDHSLSPYGNFTFEGASSATSFDWRGDGGARGQVTLRLQSHDTLQVSWFATKMGSELSLGSGSATVFRFR